MFKRRLSIVGYVLIGVVLIAIGGTIALAAGDGVRVDLNANGQSVELKRGQVLTVALEASPGTGYGWEVVDLQGNVLQQVGEKDFKARSDLLGALGEEILRFKAAQSGEATLNLVYHRSWEKDVEPLKTFTLQVTVR